LPIRTIFFVVNLENYQLKPTPTLDYVIRAIPNSAGLLHIRCNVSRETYRNYVFTLVITPPNPSAKLWPFNNPKKAAIAATSVIPLKASYSSSIICPKFTAFPTAKVSSLHAPDLTTRPFNKILLPRISTIIIML